MTSGQHKRSRQYKRICSAREGLKACVVTIALLMISSVTFAESQLLDVPPTASRPVEVRFGTTDGESVTTKQVAFLFHRPAPRWLHADRLEFGVGAISQAEESRPFVSLGPVWRWIPAAENNRWFVEFGLSPTVLGDLAKTSLVEGQAGCSQGIVPDGADKHRVNDT